MCDLNRGVYKENSIISKQTEAADEINKQSSSLTTSSTGALSFITHPQAVYTSKLLNFKNLPEPKNVDDNDHSHSPGTEFSGNLNRSFNLTLFNKPFSFNKWHFLFYRIYQNRFY